MAPRNPIKTAVLLWRFFWALKRARPDAIISFTHYANVLCQPLALLSGVSIRIASQRNPCDTYPTIARLLDRFMGGVLIYSANVAVSQSVANSFAEYGERYNSKMRVIVNGLPAIVSPSRNCVREVLGIPKDKFLVLSIGRLQPQKNQAVLIHALTHTTDVHLVIAGEGPLRQELMTLASDLGLKARVHFPGEVSRECIGSLLRVADCYAMPSAFEGMSNALLEAVQAGQAVLASDIPPQREVLMAGGLPIAGMLLPLDDPAAWAAAITKLRNNPCAKEDLKARAKDISAHFTIEGAAKKYVELIFELKTNSNYAAR